MIRKYFVPALMAAALLTGCQAPQGKFTPEQVAAMKSYGFTESNGDWSLGLSDSILFDKNDYRLRPDSRQQITTMASIAIPGLKYIPVIGPLLFDQSPMVYLTFVLVIVTAVFFGKTRAGLSYKSVGEHPQAAATLGINVIGVKYLACVICGALAGIGGAYLTTCYSSTYTDGIVAGRGFIALAAVIFGRWNAGGILLACLFFGFCDALQIRLQVSGILIPYQFFQMIPYLATVLVLSLIGTKQAGPKANGKPYRREQR